MLRRLTGFGNNQGQPRLKELQGLSHAARDAQPLPAALNDELSWAPRHRHRLDHTIGWPLVRVAKNREQGHSIAMVDRIISPIATRDMPAIKPEELIQLGPREINRSVPRTMISKGQHRRTVLGHRYPSPSRRCHVVFTISPMTSSRVTSYPTLEYRSASLERFASPHTRGYFPFVPNHGRSGIL